MTLFINCYKSIILDYTKNSVPCAFALTICLARICVKRKVPVRWHDMILSHCSSVIFSSIASRVIPVMLRVNFKTICLSNISEKQNSWWGIIKSWSAIIPLVFLEGQLTSTVDTNSRGCIEVRWGIINSTLYVLPLGNVTYKRLTQSTSATYLWFGFLKTWGYRIIKIYLFLRY